MYFFLNNALRPDSTSLPELSQTSYLPFHLLDGKTDERGSALSANNTLSQVEFPRTMV